MNEFIKNIILESEENNFFRPKGIKKRRENIIPNTLRDIENLAKEQEAHEITNRLYWLHTYEPNFEGSEFEFKINKILYRYRLLNVYFSLYLNSPQVARTKIHQIEDKIEEQNELNEVENNSDEFESSYDMKLANNNIYNPKKVYDEFYEKENSNEKSHENWELM
jgi:hypothetical protein